ncbi:EamA family transporter [Pseudonocardia xinjiangensis]|uniref:EamA family transporter n=1 Tax=Pseudonocardia xinjiangensis TaxID=75289 RepID=UPI003D8F9144
MGTSVVLIIAGAASMYVGAALATLLFGYIPAAAVAWLRVLGAAACLLAWRRPSLRTWTRRDFAVAAGLGVFAALMNVLFYQALVRLPLGTAVAIEFVGPVLVAAFGMRSWRDAGALAAAAAGVFLIADVHWTGSRAGLFAGIGAAACWALYIAIGKKAAVTASGVDKLAVGLAIATVILSPLAVTLGPAFDPTAPTLIILLLGIGLGIASNAIPYSIDQVVLARISQSLFALLLALLPLTATVIGYLALGQKPGLLELVGVAAIVSGVLLGAPDGAWIRSTRRNGHR